MPRIESLMEDDRIRPNEGPNSVIFDPAGERMGNVAGDAYEEIIPDRSSNPAQRAGQEIRQELIRPQLRVPERMTGIDREIANIDNLLADPEGNLTPEQSAQIRAQRDMLRNYQLAQQTQQSIDSGDLEAEMVDPREQAFENRKEAAWRRGKVAFFPQSQSGAVMPVTIDRDPKAFLEYMRKTLNEIQETYEPQGKQETQLELQKLFSVIPEIRRWGSNGKPNWMKQEEFDHWKGIINKLGDIMSEEFKFRFDFHSGWVKFANANSIDEAFQGMASMYTDQLNYLLIKGRNNNLLVSSAYEWFDKNAEEFLAATPSHQAEMRKKLLVDLEKSKVNPNNKLVAADGSAQESLGYTEADYKSAQIMGEQLYVLTARLAQRNYLIDKKYKNKLDPENEIDRKTINSGEVAFAYSPGSGGQSQINSSKAYEWLHTQTASNKGTIGGFPVEQLLKGVDFNDKDYFSLLPGQIYEYYRDRFFDMYKTYDTVGDAYSAAQVSAKDTVAVIFGISESGVTQDPKTGEAKFSKFNFTDMTLSRAELTDKAEKETDPVLKAKYQERLDKMNGIFNPLVDRFGSLPEEWQPELVKLWKEGDFIDFNWGTIHRTGRWGNHNVALPQKVADAIQKPGGYMIVKTTKALGEFLHQYDAIKGGRFPIQQAAVERYLKWRLNPPEGVGKLRPIDVEGFIANFSVELNLNEDQAKKIKDAIKQDRPDLELRIILNHLELDDVFNAFMHELIVGIFKAGFSGK